MHAARTHLGVLTRYLQGLGISALCTAIAYPLYPYFDPVNIVMLYLLGATVAGLRLGRGPAALTAIVNTATFDFLFVPPHQIDIRALRVYVASLRRKLESDPARPKYLVTEPGVGYRLVTDSEVEAARPDARNRLKNSL
jgi:hypothetical protein